MSDREKSAPAEWREIPGLPGYRASNTGRLQSRWGRRRAEGPWKDLVATPQGYGRLYVRVYRNGRRLRRPVHALILEAFVGPRPPGMQCCHWDGDPSNNRLDNIRWGTPKTNRADMERHGRVVRGTRVHTAKLDEAKVSEVIRLHRSGSPKARIAKSMGISDTAVRLILKGQNWSHFTGILRRPAS